MDVQRPFSQACENNKNPILAVLKSAFAPSKRVLEIGSGTGQHAVYFSQHLSHLIWQPSDVKENLPGLTTWLNSTSQPNLAAATTFEIGQADWPTDFDAVFSANTAHIMPWSLTQKMVTGAGEHLPYNGVLVLYGPFNYGGRFTSESNAEFDLWLKSRGSHQGIRDFETVNECAELGGLNLICDHAMPSNNRLVVWKKL